MELVLIIVLLVRSAVNNRALAVANRDGNGGGGERAVTREFKNVVVGCGRF